MKKTGSKKTDSKRLAELSLLAAIIVVLTVICTFVKFGPFSITLALAPIIIGASIYGAGTGAFLGFIFGLVVLITGLFGWDGGTVNFLLSVNPVALIVICLGKGAAAGFVSGLIYKALEKKNMKLGVLLAGIACPVVNTGLFILGMVLFFMSTLQTWAGGQNIVTFVIVGLTGINFLIELIVNIVLASAITAIIKYRKGLKN